MKLSSKCEYACLALICLSERYNEGLVKILDVAESKKIPKKFLEQILITLKRQGYVKSKKGANGGYQLAKPPKEITLAEIIRLMDGALAPVESVSEYYYEPTPTEQDERLLAVFRQIRNYISDFLENITFQDIISKKINPKKK
ncbi:MAG: RrF2 family transcriptional regulator [Spirochaetaceae bacterium]|nr:MAG: RrF2 family transcriptional regulator [Spirochaetaceae bacterium]